MVTIYPFSLPGDVTDRPGVSSLLPRFLTGNGDCAALAKITMTIGQLLAEARARRPSVLATSQFVKLPSHRSVKPGLLLHHQVAHRSNLSHLRQPTPGPPLALCADVG
jgi:hypothetical protein